MNAKTTVLTLFIGFSIALVSACNPPERTAHIQKVSQDSDDRTQPEGGGSCSATSDDGTKTCSISCPAGKSANCSNTKTTVSCKCSH